MIKKFVNYALCILSGALLFFCGKKFDKPPYKTLNERAKLEVSDLKKRVAQSNSLFRFGLGDTNLYCMVIADETSGSLYKQVFVRDEGGGAILLNLATSGGLYVGDKLRINLNNLCIVNANNMISIDSVSLEKNLIKLSSGNVVTPLLITLSDIYKNQSPSDPLSLQSQLVEINAVEFDTSSRGKPFGDFIGKTTVSRLLTNCSFQELTVRTSGFANFASKLTPTGNGKIIGVLSQYQNTIQLLLRQYSDVSMNAQACTSATQSANTTTFVLATPTASLFEQFNSVNSNLDFSGTNWINFNQTGSVKWKGDLVMPSYTCVKASAFNSGNNNNIVWLISQPIVYNSALTFSFNSAFTYWDNGHQDALNAFVSTNFNGKNFYTANWTKINSASYADGSGSQYTGPTGMKSSGNISLQSVGILNGYSGSFCIAFRYVGSPAYNSTIYLDDIRVQ